MIRLQKTKQKPIDINVVVFSLWLRQKFFAQQFRQAPRIELKWRRDDCKTREPHRHQCCCVLFVVEAKVLCPNSFINHHAPTEAFNSWCLLILLDKPFRCMPREYNLTWRRHETYIICVAGIANTKKAHYGSLASPRLIYGPVCTVGIGEILWLGYFSP